MYFFSAASTPVLVLLSSWNAFIAAKMPASKLNQFFSQSDQPETDNILSSSSSATSLSSYSLPENKSCASFLPLGGVSSSNFNGRSPRSPSMNPTPCFVHTKFDEVLDVSKALKALSSSDNISSLSHSRLVKTATGVRELAKRLGQANIRINVRSVMVVTKARDNSLIYLTRDLVYWLMATHNVTVYVDSKLEKSKRFNSHGLVKKHPSFKTLLKYWDPDMTNNNPEQFDLVITLGGDGTVLYVGGLFQHIVPPVMSFSLGSLGFLTNFRFEYYKKHISRVFETGINVNLRMRFSCSVHDDTGKKLFTRHVLNEIVIDRGPSPWVSMLELYGNDSLLTVVQADGLILSTPTGSTAYSLSAGGSLVHPEVAAMSVTPICPHTLSFRPMLLPDSMVLRVNLPTRSRSTAWASFDGRHRTQLFPGYYVTVRASQFPFPTIVSSPTEYIDSVSRTLKWNVRQQQKPFEHLLSTPTRKQYDDDTGSEDYVSKDEDPEFDIDYEEPNA